MNLNTILAAGALCLASPFATTAPAFAGTFEEVTDFGANPGNLRMFTYEPDDMPAGAPLVVVLHGCRQNAPDYFEHGGWQQEADAGGFALILPQQQTGPGPLFTRIGLNHPTNCFNFAEIRDSTRGSGEALSIRQMVEAAIDRMDLDASRVYVNGLSAGGGMSAVMLATYPEVFAAGAIIAGPPYRCGDRTLTAPRTCGVTLDFQAHNPAPDRTAQDWGDRVRAAAPPGFTGPWPRVAIWQGDADGTVDPLNARELVEQWTDVHGIDARPDRKENLGAALREIYTDADGTILVERYTLPGFGHATPIDPDATGAPCGAAGSRFIRDADICSTRAIAAFFGLRDSAPPNGPDTPAEAWRRASGTWIDHMSAGRLRAYASPCPNIGFGTCDADFPAIHSEHRFTPFDLFAAAGSNTWFADPANIR